MTEKTTKEFMSLEESFFNPTDKNNITFACLYTNIRSIRHNFDNFLLEFSQIKNRIHFVIFSEIWIGTDQLNLYNIPGYKKFASCNENYRAGGVLCFVLDEIAVQQDRINSIRTADSLLLNVRLNNSYFKVCCMYRLQQFGENEFIEELSDYTQYLNTNAVLIGDMNLNILNKNSQVTKYMNLLNDNGFLSLINAPTRRTNSTSTCIDHIFIKDRRIDKYETAIFDVNLTDHCMLGLVFKKDSKNEMNLKEE